MKKKFFINLHEHLLLFMFMFFLFIPASTWAADKWEYPTGNIKNPFGGGKGTKDDPYIISTAQHLANLAHMVTYNGESYSGKYFLMTNDIVLNDNVISPDLKKVEDGSGYIRYSDNKEHFDKLMKWTPIGDDGYWGGYKFKGIFDGGGHSISGIYCNEPLVNGKIYTGTDADYELADRGLFGKCVEARISNLTIKDSFYAVRDRMLSIGGLIGYCERTTINNCHMENCIIAGNGDWKSTKYNSYVNIGGLIGYLGKAYGDMTDCSFDGIIDAYVFGKNNEDWYIGGLVGDASFQKGYFTFGFNNCHSKGELFYNELIDVENGSCCIASGLLGYRAVDGEADVAFTDCSNRMNLHISTNSKNPSSSERNKSILSAFSNTWSICKNCVNYGNIEYGPRSNQGYTNNKESENLVVEISGIARSGNLENCINYGNITINPFMYANSTTASGLTTSDYYLDNSIKSCLFKGSINYRFKNGSPTVDPLSISEPNTISSTYYYAICNGKELTSQFNANKVSEDEFKKYSLAYDLNNLNNSSVFGIIQDESDPFYGYVSLTSGGATIDKLEGKGTEADPYLIASKEELFAMQNYALNKDNTGKYYKLTRNLDLTHASDFSSIEEFNGILDGDGHYIRGIKLRDGYLIKNLYGTVKNLALLDITNYNNSHIITPLANYVGDKHTIGIISNCYVTGNLTLEVNENNCQNALFYATGICDAVLDCGVVENSYFNGSIKVKDTTNGENSSSYSLHIGGIANSNKGGISNCYAIMDYANIGDKKTNDNLGSICAYNDGVLSNDFGKTNLSGSKFQPKATAKFDGVTEKESYENIKTSDLGEHWIQGINNAVLKNAYHYQGKDYKGNNVYLDASQLTPTNNDIITIIPTEEQKADTKMWQMPNVAVYSDEINADILTNFTIIPAMSFNYKASKTDVKLKGSANYPIQAKNGENWYSLCLPGEVKLTDLPDGCKLYVGGTLRKEDNKNVMNIVQVEDVPAGVPFFLYYNNPNTEYDFYITMTGDLATQASLAAENSSLKGNLQFLGKNKYGKIQVKPETGEKELQSYYVNCFSAYTDSDSPVEIHDYLLLDENSEHSNEDVKEYNGKSVNVKMRQELKAGEWNPICVPFKLYYRELDDIFGTGTKIEELRDVSYDKDSQTLTFTFGFATEIEPGATCLINPTSDIQFADYGNRNISDGLHPALYYGIDLGNGMRADFLQKGSFTKEKLSSTEKENVLYWKENGLRQAPSQTEYIVLGFSNWITCSDANGKAIGIKNIIVKHGDGSIVTGINKVNANGNANNAHIFDLRGIQQNEMKRGVNIVNGKKIMKQ